MLRIPIDPAQIRNFCDRWRITELSVFGSAIRDDFGPESDVDVLVVFEIEAAWSLHELVLMQEELEGMIGRPVDLVERDALRNPYRRHAILSNREILHAV